MKFQGELVKFQGENVKFHLIRKVLVLLLALRTQGVPPLAKDLGHGPVVLVGILLVHQRPMAFTENHERIHGPSDFVEFVAAVVLGVFIGVIGVFLGIFWCCIGSHGPP